MEKIYWILRFIDDHRIAHVDDQIKTRGGVPSYITEGDVIDLIGLEYVKKTPRGLLILTQAGREFMLVYQNRDVLPDGAVHRLGSLRTFGIIRMIDGKPVLTPKGRRLLDRCR